MELFALIRAVFWFVFMDSWLLGPHVNLSPWLDAEAEEKQDTGMGGGGHLGSRVMSNPAELRLLVQMQKQLWAPHTTGRLALGSWGDHISVTKESVLCSVLLTGLCSSRSYSQRKPFWNKYTYRQAIQATLDWTSLWMVSGSICISSTPHLPLQAWGFGN